MKRGPISVVASIIILFLTTPSIEAFTAEEHSKIATEAVELVAPDCDGIVPDADAVIYDKMTFPELCATWAEVDRSFARYHRKGESVLSQLRHLTAADLQGKFDVALSYGSKVADLEDRSGGVVVNFLIYHYVAIRLAVLASENPARDRAMIDRFLAYEARAQGYLVDGYSSAHMLVPSSGILNAVLDCNLGHAHDHYRDEGLYVINSEGESWRAFGDGLMYYYPATHDPILEACITSLREVCLVYAVNRDAVPAALADWGETLLGDEYQSIVGTWTTAGDGTYYYKEANLSSLMMIPMPVSATWSVRSETVDSLGIAQRKHFPQLRDSGMHDPSLEPDIVDFLYSAIDVPEWMQFDRLLAISATQIVRSEADVASVRFVQDRSIRPTFRGLLTTYSLTGIVNDAGKGWGATFGLGYGVADDLLLVQNPSIEVRVAPGFDEPERFLLMLGIGATFDLDMLSSSLLDVSLPEIVRRFRFDAAYVNGMRDRYQASGARLFGGFELPPMKMPISYMGFAMRVGYQVTILERTLHGPTIEIALH